jgi:hypothetical protein
MSRKIYIDSVKMKINPNCNWTCCLYHVVHTHFISVMKITQSVLYTHIFVVRSEIYTQHGNTLCEQNLVILKAKPGGK